MVVYLTRYDGQGGYGPHRFVLGIYSTKAKAKEAIEDDFKTRQYHSRLNYYIEEYEVDQ